jgi:hypothetical protein
MQLQLTVQSENAANLVIGLWSSNIILNALDSDTTLTNYGYTSPVGTYYVPAGDAGRTVTIDLTTTSLAASFVSLAQANGFFYNGRALQGAGLLIGCLQGSATHIGNVNGGYSTTNAEDFYCAFSGATGDTTAAQLVITYTAAGSSMVAAGDGAPGYIVVRYINDQGTPVSLVLPNTYTDAGGNAHAAGFNALAQNYNTYQPGSSPTVVEGWHTITPINGWVAQNGSAPCRYRLAPGNIMLIELQINDSSATSGVFMTMPSGYSLGTTQFCLLALGSAAAGTTVANVQFATGAGANVVVLSWVKQSKQYLGNIYVTLD